jgi:hypothetical protein
MMASYRSSVLDDIPFLANNLRKADEVELKASCGMQPLEALRVSFGVSKECNTILTSDVKIAGIFGISELNSTIGCPWLMGTDDLPTIGYQFLRESKRWVEAKNEEYPILTNYVHVDNEVAINWLRFLGFKFINLVEEYGVGRKPFYEFVRIKDV